MTTTCNNTINSIVLFLRHVINGSTQKIKKIQLIKTDIGWQAALKIDFDLKLETTQFLVDAIISSTSIVDIVNIAAGRPPPPPSSATANRHYCHQT